MDALIRVHLLNNLMYVSFKHRFAATKRYWFLPTKVRMCFNISELSNNIVAEAHALSAGGGVSILRAIIKCWRVGVTFAFLRCRSFCLGGRGFRDAPTADTDDVDMIPLLLLMMMGNGEWGMMMIVFVACSSLLLLLITNVDVASRRCSRRRRRDNVIEHSGLFIVCHSLA